MEGGKDRGDWRLLFGGAENLQSDEELRKESGSPPGASWVKVEERQKARGERRRSRRRSWVDPADGSIN